MARASSQMNRLWRSSTSFSMSKKILRRVSGRSRSGKMMRVICFNMVFLLTWLRTRNLLRNSVTKIGSPLLKSFRPKMQRNVIRGGCSSKSLAETRQSGPRRRMRSWSPWSWAMGPETGRILLRSWTIHWLSSSRTPTNKKVANWCSPREMVSNAEKDGSLPWTHPSIRVNGACEKTWISWRSGWKSGTSGERLPTSLRAEQSPRWRIASSWS